MNIMGMRQVICGNDKFSKREVTISIRGKYYCYSDDNSSLFDKKSALQTKYRPLSLINTAQIQTTFSENTDQN